MNHRTGETVALKKLKLDQDRKKQVDKEILIHQHLKNQNIIKYIDHFEHLQDIYIVQELAIGGELFEQIEPDSGFHEHVAHFYFVQLIRSIVRISIPNITIIVINLFLPS